VSLHYYERKSSMYRKQHEEQLPDLQSIYVYFYECDYHYGMWTQHTQEML